MKTFKILTLLMAGAGTAIGTQAADFNVTQAKLLGEGNISNSLKHKVSFMSPVNDVCFEFNSHIVATGNIQAYLLDGNDILAQTSDYRIDNLTIGDKDCGDLYMNFGKFCAPVGGEYTIRLIAGAVSPEADTSMLNEEVSFNFTVPADFGEAEDFFTSVNGISIQKYVATSQSLHAELAGVWNKDGKMLGTPEWELYREGELIGKYPSQFSWDWDQTEMKPEFGECVYFEDGVNYSLVLPAGSVCAPLREDILSKEFRIDFIGAYSETTEFPKYTYCNAWMYDWDKIGEVVFTYDVPFDLETVKDMKVQLTVEDENGTTVYEEVPELSKGYAWFLSADFGGVDIEEGKTYTLSVPEGTVRKANGQSGIKTITGERLTGCQVKVAGKTVNLSGMTPGSNVTVLDASGKVINSFTATKETASITVPSSGMYVVTVDDMVFKVIL